MRVAACRLALVATLTLGATPDPMNDVRGAIASFDAHRDRAVAEAGMELAYDLKRRLIGDLETTAADKPDDLSDERWSAIQTTTFALDVDLMRQLVGGVAHPLDRTPGLYETFVPSSVDGTWQPVAVYVPPTLSAQSRPSLAIVLHGRPQTESELLAPDTLRRLADSTQTILVAPYGRGYYDFGAPADRDVNDLATLAVRTLQTDERRTYLVGYSMGGFSVYRIGLQPNRRWAGVMSISGAVVNSIVDRVAFAWRVTPLYVLNGARDQSIPPEYGARSAEALAGRGVPVSFYQQPDGSHRLRSLLPALARAWDDMVAGTVRAETIPSHSGGGLPAGPTRGGFPS